MWKRVLAVTAGLAVTGAIVGGVLGALLVLAFAVTKGEAPADPELYLFAATLGGLVGCVLGPISAWLLMRRIPLWQAIGGTALGTAAGFAYSVLAQQDVFTWPIVGFGASALAMNLHARWRDKRLAAPRATSAGRLSGG